ncbi:DUF1295 domain-containing protein [Lysobacter sp. SG-8]|uniref:DUF1295 domain-containing protein n=1 Tax=Marilutibacter penaei TaxID=2759900 RepID=A0A7W3U3S0_9GAMM|nr:DUF1295 domain-containing protein [Lysobacter penaei]MBB1088414.1 DUF1295 domain-containing protein [Lysobacter penaei]
MTPLWALGTIGCVMSAVMFAGWAWERRHRNAGIVDVLWAAGMGFAGIWLAWVGSGDPRPRLLLAILAGVWSLRLALHLWARVRSEDEDGRYRHLRHYLRDRGWAFLLFFQAQALLVVLFALPFLAVAANPVVSVPWLVAGVLVWAAGLVGEAVADRQLAAFRADRANAGKVCDVGPWRYSRHPNYFFEWLQWWAYVCLAIGSPWMALAWLGPVLMYLFLRYLSGIPFTEAQAERTRGDAYRAYRARTPMLFPWFPQERRQEDIA